MNYLWMTNDRCDTHYLYHSETGQVQGQVHQLAHTKIWVSKTWDQNLREFNLGQFVSLDHAKTAAHNWVIIQSRTLLQ